MSYLDVPRLHFSGSFIAKPSTVNNTATNFDPATPSTPPGLVLAWNPYGNHDWQFLNCAVQTAVTSDGTVWNSSYPEPIIGAAVDSTDKPVTAKLVDLDTEQQMVSQIWGLQIKVGVADSKTDYFVGNFRVISFDDIWFRVPNGQQDWMFSAYYQSVLDDVTWGPKLTSPFLKQLQSASPSQLSIKFVVDAYQDLYYQKNFNQGRIVGTIGPASPDDPPNFLRGRQLRPVGFQSANPFSGTPLYYGYAKVDAGRQRVIVDLGNSIPTQADVSGATPTQSADGPPVELGTLSVAIMSPEGSNTILGEYDYSLSTYLATAGVQEYSVTKDQLDALAQTPLGVMQTPTPGASAAKVLQESPTGAFIHAIQPVWRMNPGDSVTAEIMAFQFGEPAREQFIGLNFNSNMLQPPTPPPTPPENYAVGTPPSALTFPQSVVTGGDGRASFELGASDPNNPRQVIDGQVYGIGFSWGQDNLRDFPSNPNSFFSVLVFDAFPKGATWQNIQPFMMQYATLYPFMDSIFMLSDPAVYQQNIAAFKAVLSYPDTDPRYMPVTRDMSRDKRQRLLDWLDAGAPL